MGMYTEFHYNAELKPNISKEIERVLQYMTGCLKEPLSSVPEHTLFDTYGWQHFLTTDSFYFPAITNSVLDECYLSIRCNTKNFGCISEFIDWIDPYLNHAPGEFLGFYRYESTNKPTLIYKKEY